MEFHRRLPGYEPTLLVEAESVARALGVGRVWVKDESSRLGLPAFKILGASWATYRALEERLGRNFGDWETLDELSEMLEPLRPLDLVTATDGNHGRAVSRIARLFGLGARVFVPVDMAEARSEAIKSEGAEVVVVDGTYDEAVESSAEQEGERGLLISDTSWPGYERVPSWVIEGYSTMLWEVDDELERRNEQQPDLIAIQIGVGALAAAVARHYRKPDVGSHTKIVGVEPLGAAGVLASMEVGNPIPVPGPHTSIMAGLNCGTPSLVAWPTLSQGIDLFVAIEDENAREAMRLLSKAGIVSGETGGAGLGGLLELFADEEIRNLLGVGPETGVLLFNSEGATDPQSYERIVSGESSVG